MENKEAEVVKEEDQEVYEEAFMIDEDKQAICDALCKALQQLGGCHEAAER